MHSVTLLVVTKTFPASDVREAFEAGECRFGENYVQEAVDKIDALADLRERVEWHLIGPLQSNKTRVVAERFDWVHSVDRLKKYVEHTGSAVLDEPATARAMADFCLRGMDCGAFTLEEVSRRSGLDGDTLAELALRSLAE